LPNTRGQTRRAKPDNGCVDFRGQRSEVRKINRKERKEHKENFSSEAAKKKNGERGRIFMDSASCDFAQDDTIMYRVSV